MDAIENARRDLQKRLHELRPYLEEAERIKHLLRVMEDAHVEEVSGTAERPRVSSDARRLQILSLLKEAEEPIRIKDLAISLAITPGRVSQLVGRLVEDGQVSRGPNGLEITELGAGMVPPELEISVGVWEKVEIDE